MLKIKYLTTDNQIQPVSKEVFENNIDYYLSTCVWIDIIATETIDKSLINFLESTLNLNPLVIKDAFRKRHPPKIEFFENYIFMLYRGISQAGEKLDFEHQQMAFFISDKMLITIHSGQSLGIKKVIESDDIFKLIQNPMALAIKILHNSSSIYLEHILNFENELSIKEDQLEDTSKSEMALAELSIYRSRLIKLKRVFNYHHSLSNQLKSHRKNTIEFDIENCNHLIIDLDDLFERLYSLTQMQYDICGGMIDGYISIASHQLNMTMRVLTVVTAIFVPLSFLAGLYGMNFEYIPELKYNNAYFILLGFMCCIALFLVFLFKNKKWF